MRSHPGKSLLSALLFLVAFGSCQVMLVGAYDPVTDQSIQKVQNEVMTIFVRLERNFKDGQPDANQYDRFRDTYITINGEVESLRIRCQSLPKYQLVLQQVDLLRENLGNLEKYHQAGFKSPEEVLPMKKAFESEFSAMVVLQTALKRKKSD